jgi:hypothetical protein
VPLLAHFLPLQFVVPLLLVTDFSASVLMSHQDRRRVDWAEIRALLLPGAVGVVVGVLLLINLPKGPLLTGLGLFVALFGLRNILNLHGERPVSRWWALPSGLTGGAVGALFGTGGPPYVIYLAHRLRDKTVLRATFSGLFMIDGGVRLAAFAIAGLLLQPHLGWAILGALPLMIFGLLGGARVHVGLTQRQMLTIIGILLLVSGVSLLWRAWLA